MKENFTDEEEFNALIKLWLEDKISYKRVMDNRPVYRADWGYKIFKWLKEWFRSE